MTGPEHYREAERLISGLMTDRGAVYVADGNEQVIAAAQVHATLAGAAATIAAPYVVEGDTTEEWVSVVGGAPAETGEPAESYPGELAHLRDLLADLGKLAQTTEAVNDLLIDHYSDSRRVDATLAAHAAAAKAGEPR